MIYRGSKIAKIGRSGGFALPTVLIASIIMLSVLMLAVASSAAVRVSIKTQYYDQLAKSASDAGAVYARYCLDKYDGVPQWSDSKPLAPNTDCKGDVLNDDVSSLNCASDPFIIGCSIASDNENNLVSTFSVKSPTVSPGSIKQISAGGDHTCAIASDDKAYCWGDNTSGQLGNGTRGAISHVPIAVFSGTSDQQGDLYGKTILSISAGVRHTCVIASDYKAYCWGSNYFGQTGKDEDEFVEKPRLVSQGAIPDNVRILSISAGQAHTCAIAANKKSYCWGANSAGQLGNGATVTKSSAPVLVNGNMNFRSISAGSGETKNNTQNLSHTCAVDYSNNAYCWGYNKNGQIGNGGTSTPILALSKIEAGTGGGVTFSSISAGSNTTCAVQSDLLKVWCWGDNYSGQLGNTPTFAPTTEPLPASRPFDSNEPVQIYSLGYLAGKSIMSVSVSSTSPNNDARVHVCVTANDSQAYCWGDNKYGSMGDFWGYRYKGADQYEAPVTPAGDSYWGRGFPMPVYNSKVLFSHSIMSITSGANHTCVIAVDEHGDNKVYCWGRSTSGQLGTGKMEYFGYSGQGYIDSFSTDGNKDNSSPEPMAVMVNGLFDSKIKKLVSTGTTKLLKSDKKTIWRQYSQTTQLKQAGLSFKQISTGYSNSCGIASDDKVYCWGHGSNGQNGNGRNGFWADNNTPTAVYTGTAANPGHLYDKKIKKVSVGKFVACVIASDDKAYCWGGLGSSIFSYGNAGENGNGMFTGSMTPQPVAEPLKSKTVIDIDAGNYGTCAIDSDKKAYCWGGIFLGSEEDKVYYGWNGDGTTNGSNKPVAVNQGGLKFASISTGGLDRDALVSKIGYGHTCALTDTQDVYCWGDNSYGQIGNNTTNTDSGSTDPKASINNSVTSPEKVFGSRKYKSIGVGGDLSCALGTDDKLYCWGGSKYSFSLYGDQGRMGSTGYIPGNNNVPTLVIQPSYLDGANISSFSVGELHVCVATTTTKKVYCIGSNHNGEMAIGTKFPFPLKNPNNYQPSIIVPTQIYDANTGNNTGKILGQDIISIDSGRQRTCAIVSSGSVYCWGTGNADGDYGPAIPWSPLPELMLSPTALVAI